MSFSQIVVTSWITDGEFSIRMYNQDLQVRKNKKAFLTIHPNGYYKLFQKDISQKDLEKDFSVIYHCFKVYPQYSASLELFHLLTKKPILPKTVRRFFRRTLKRIYIKFWRSNMMTEFMKYYKEAEKEKDPNA